MLLTAMIFVPLGGALLVCARGDTAEKVRRIALGTAGLSFLLAVAAAAMFLGGADLSMARAWLSVPASGGYGVELAYHVGLDGISLWLVVLTAMLTPLAIAASFSSIRERVREYYALMLVLETGMLGVFCARDLLLFYVFFEFTLVPLFFLIGIWGGPERRRAANKFFIFTMAGSMFTFAGVLYLAWRASQELGTFTFSFDALYQLAGVLSPDEQWWLFLALLAGFAIKVPLFPLHTWLPLAHTEAPTAGSVILAGVLLKLGTYGLLRFNLPMLPDATMALAQPVAIVAIIGIIYGALVAWVQDDIKKLVAYSSVSHLGFCVLGMFSLTEAGLRGSLLYMVNHGLATGALFLVIGMVYERYHTRSIHVIGGLARKMPVMAFFLIVFTLSSIGLPGLNGFVGEFLVLLGTFTSAGHDGALGWQYAAFAALGIILSAVYMLWLCQRVLFGPLREPEGTPDTSTGLSQDLNPREIGILTPIAVCCLVLGVAPNLMLDSMGPALDREVLARILPQPDPDAPIAVVVREGEAPAEPRFGHPRRLGGSLVGRGLPAPRTLIARGFGNQSPKALRKNNLADSRTKCSSWLAASRDDRAGYCCADPKRERRAVVRSPRRLPEQQRETHAARRLARRSRLGLCLHPTDPGTDLAFSICRWCEIPISHQPLATGGDE